MSENDIKKAFTSYLQGLEPVADHLKLLKALIDSVKDDELKARLQRELRAATGDLDKHARNLKDGGLKMIRRQAIAA